MTPSSPGRIAIVHDFFTQLGGAERLVGDMARLLPDATLHASVVDADRLPEPLRVRRIRTTPLQRLFTRGVPLTALAPLLPTAFGRMRFDDVDVLLSSTSAFAHHVNPPAGAIHVAYCHTPPHFLHGGDDYFRGRRLTGLLAEPALALTRRSDRAAAGRVDAYIGNSRFTADRIRDVYDRDAVVVYPPIETARFEPSDERSGQFLIVSRLRRHKRLDLAIDAATRHGWPLDVVGDGPEELALRRSAGPTIRFLGRLPDAAVVAAMVRCVALLVPATEDFGMTMAEVQAAGRPPIAFGRGGALEIIVDGTTGFLFNEPSIDAVSGAMARAMDADLDRGALVASAARFDRSVFDAGLLDVIARARG